MIMGGKLHRLAAFKLNIERNIEQLSQIEVAAFYTSNLHAMMTALYLL